MPPWVSMYADRSGNRRTIRRSVSVDSLSSNTTSSGSSGRRRSRWSPSSFINSLNAMTLSRRSSNPVLESATSLDYDDAETGSQTEVTNSGDDTKSTKSVTPSLRPKKDRYSLVTVVLVEAKGLPDVPHDGSTSHGLYCRLHLGSQSQRSKTVTATDVPRWGERFQFRNIYKEDSLKITLWDKGKQKIFMGKCAIDLKQIEKERTVEIWQKLDDGYGSVHLAVTICNARNSEVIAEEVNEEDLKTKYNLFNLKNDWNQVGELHVKVVGVKGLGGKHNAYCTLEVDNEKVRTHESSPTHDPTWDRNFVFHVRDVTSTLDLKVCENSIASALALRDETLGRLTIPLLRIINGEKKWYALKDKSKRNIAKGHCPRILLEMNFRWNPVKASLRVFRPKELKYVKKSRKFDIGLIYKNTEFIKDTFVILVDANESFKKLFEWENVEYSATVLFAWLIFWYYFRPWTTPLLLLIPFFYSWITNRHQHEKSFMRNYGVVDETNNTSSSEKELPYHRKLSERINTIPEMTITITDGIQYMGSLAEKLYNLATFKVPFLSYLVMFLLTVLSIGLYFIHFNYLMMMFGIYKFTRKYINPDRILNNDIADFLTRIPDTDQLRDWKELNVPEPSLRSVQRSRSSRSAALSEDSSDSSPRSPSSTG